MCNINDNVIMKICNNNMKVIIIIIMKIIMCEIM